MKLILPDTLSEFKGGLSWEQLLRGWPLQAIGKPFTLWTSFARFYERNGSIENARIIFERATSAEFKYVDDLASVWCEYAEMELRKKNFKNALQLLRRATATPLNYDRRQVGLFSKTRSPNSASYPENLTPLSHS